MPLETLDQTVRKGKNPHMRSASYFAGLARLLYYLSNTANRLDPAVLDVFANFVKQHVKCLQLKVDTKTKLGAFRALNFDFMTDGETAAGRHGQI